MKWRIEYSKDIEKFIDKTRCSHRGKGRIKEVFNKNERGEC